LSFRYVPSQADTAVFEALKGAPAAEHAHALRWYNHIKSFGAGMKQFPKAAKNAADYASGAAAAGGKAAAKEEDDDVDLFGSGGSPSRSIIDMVLYTVLRIRDPVLF
jgi:elongation factor 1-beta